MGYILDRGSVDSLRGGSVVMEEHLEQNRKCKGPEVQGPVRGPVWRDCMDVGDGVAEIEDWRHQPDQT